MKEILDRNSNSTDLIEIISIVKYLLGQWKIIMSSILLFTLLGLNTIYQDQPRHETEAIFETGSYILSDDELLRSLNVFMIKGSDQNFPTVEMSIIEKNLIKIKLNSFSVQDNLNLLNLLRLHIKETERENYNSFIAEKDEILDIDKKRILSLIDLNKDELSFINKWKNLTDSIELRSLLRSNETRIYKEIINLEAQLQNPKDYQLVESQMLTEPKTNVIKSNFLSTIISSIIFGFIAALAFLTLKHFIIVYRRS
jgi:hypothetical protein